MRRGDKIAETLRSLPDGGNTMALTLETTSMGFFAPPPFEWDRGGNTLSFPIGGGRRMTLNLWLPESEAKWVLK